MNIFKTYCVMPSGKVCIISSKPSKITLKHIRFRPQLLRSFLEQKSESSISVDIETRAQLNQEVSLQI